VFCFALAAALAVAMSFRLPFEKPAPEYTEMKVSQAK
jgi:hypothetical protein